MLAIKRFLSGLDGICLMLRLLVCIPLSGRLAPYFSFSLLKNPVIDRICSHNHWGTLIDNTLDSDSGIGIGASQWRLRTVVAMSGSWAELIRTPKRPEGETRFAAMGRIVLKRSTARRVTTSAGGCAGNRVSGR